MSEGRTGCCRVVLDVVRRMLKEMRWERGTCWKPLRWVSCLSSMSVRPCLKLRFKFVDRTALEENICS